MLKLIKYHPLFAYCVGDVFKVNEADTKILTEEGYAVPATEDEASEAQAKANAEDDAKLLKEMEEAETATDKAAESALNDAKNKGTKPNGKK